MPIRNPKPARIWDKLPKEHKKFALVPVDGEIKEVPVNRPCDWCGEIVDIGYLHHGECSKEDTKFWLDVLYN
jgi:hypothetical protein